MSTAVAAERVTTPAGMPAALLDDVLAAHAGHPVYPTDRCRHGLGDDDLTQYAPEHAPRFAALARRPGRRYGSPVRCRRGGRPRTGPATCCCRCTRSPRRGTRCR
ncbi:IucA/IucC family protein [Micromonospora sp. BRA006-A]|nr:IucA/IucC family protein [Micromonospora sp. BRA006-A]